jgi:putative membrane protein
MGGADQSVIVETLQLAGGSIVLRPYVFGFLAVYLTAATGAWGWRRSMAFTCWAGALTFAAEWSSTRVGVPFGLYHYTGDTVGRELYLSNVPFFDSLSFTFLAYASLGLAGQLLRRGGQGVRGAARRWPAAGTGGTSARVRLAALTGFLMLWLDVVIDPLAVRGDRWFLGRIFYYPEPGWYFGVPVANFVGWVVVGAAIAWGWDVLAPRIREAPPAWARRLPARPYHAPGLYYLVLLFNLAMTAVIGEPVLLLAGLLLHAPLAGVVVCSLRSRQRADGLPARAGETA